MSWWDTAGFTNLASQALKNAQKKIDKVLDIEEDKHGKQSKKKENARQSENREKSRTKQADNDGDFWSTWMGSSGEKTKDDTSSTPSSWNLPWGSSNAAKETAAEEDVPHGAVPGGKTEIPASSSESETLVVESPSVGSQLQKVARLENLPEELTDMEKSPLITCSESTVVESDSSEWKDFSVDSAEAICKGEDLALKAEENYFDSRDEHKQGDVKFDSFIGEKQDTELHETPDTVLQEIDASTSILVVADKTPVCNTVSDSNTAHFSGSKDDVSKAESREAAPCSELSESNNAGIRNIQHDSYIPSEPCNTLSDPDLSSKQVTDSETVRDANVADRLYKCEEELQPPEWKDECKTSPEIISGLSEEGFSALSDTSVAGFPKPSEEHLLMLGDGNNKTEQSDNASEPCLSTSENLSKVPSDLIQDYVNISETVDPNQSASFDGSVISSDDVLPSSRDFDLGNSRTSSDLDLPGGRASSTESSDVSKLDSSLDTVVDKGTMDAQTDSDVPDQETSYSLFGDGNEGNKSQMMVSDTSSLGSSFVKCMIEEAMEESNKIEDSGSDNHSSGEKSESSKVDSERSVYSGHESSDEIETTTSSDIEIISAPTPNGENKLHSSLDLAPLKIALQRAAGTHGHQRSDSQSSSSSHSKFGELDRLSPERGDGHTWREEDVHHPNLEAVTEEAADSPYHPERLLKLAQTAVQQHLNGGQKLAEMAEVLQARETKLVQLSTENHHLVEDNNILRNQLQQSEEAREAENADLTALTEEFTTRIGESEKKMQAVLKEKDNLKQQLTAAKSEIERRSQNSDIEAMLEEKTEQVNELLAEGEKLSKQQLQSSNIIKKLRAKEKETDATLTSQKKKLEEQAAELERLMTVLDSKEDMEKKQAEAISQLNAAVQKQVKDLGKITSDLEDAQEKNRGLQAALDSSYKEIAELHRSNASQDSKAQEAALSAETFVREELKAAMEKEQQRFRQEREAFIIQADDLRMDMARLEKEHSRREDVLRQEIAHLQERLQEDEARSQDVSQSVTQATRPLLRQIENIQATFGAQSSAWEKVEKSLTDRLAESQTATAMAQEKERSANERVMEMTAKVTTLEATNTRLKQEKAQLTTQLEEDHSKLEELQDAQGSYIVQLESGKQKLSQELSQLKIEKVQLDSQFTLEKSKLDAEKKKVVALEEQLRLMERDRPRSRGTPSPSPSMSVSRQESLSGSFYDQSMTWSFHDESDSGSATLPGSKTNVYESLRQSGATVLVENLQSQLKLREGEIVQLQSEIAQLERTRESMARELVNLTNQNEELQESKEGLKQLQEQYKELNSRYSAILQMYGEKEEQVQELQLDLQDVKEMYKTQIDALLAQ